MVRSRIQTEKEISKLLINEEKQYELAYMTYLTDRNRYEDFVREGYELFSFPVFFGTNHLNEHSKLTVFTKGIFDDIMQPDFSIVDHDVEMILEACPNAYIFPRVNVSLSRRWELEHREELCDSYPDGELGRASFASDLWAEEVKRELSLFIQHMQSMPYAEHIVGYQVAGGNTEEWLPVDVNGISGQRALEKYEAYLKRHGLERNSAAFGHFYSELTAGRILEFATHIKNLTNREQVVGTFYGYTFEVTGQKMGHHALRLLLESEDIDFICSPVSYSQVRALGRNHPYMLPVDSLRLHGKLYFSENDTRTHLSRPVNATPHYTQPIWFGPNRDKTCDVIKMHAARALINGHTAWWFDMWGGWYADEAYMKLLGEIRDLFEKSRNLPMKNLAEVAVFIDEEVLDQIEDSMAAQKVVYEFRETLGKLGVPLAWYLSSDAEAVMDRYKAVISLVPAKSELSEKIAETAVKRKQFCIEITEANVQVSTMELRERLKNAGVHIWCDRDAVIYANESYVFLHTTESGECMINTPKECTLIDVFSQEEFKDNSYHEKGKSYLLKCSG